MTRTCVQGAATPVLLDDYSIEITARDLPRIADAGIPSGTNVSVTFLPGESEDARVDAARAIRDDGLVPIPHFSARGLRSAAELDDFLVRLSSAARADRAFVIAGDRSEALGPYADALALIRSGKFARHGYRLVGIAGYPEGHPQIESSRLWAALADKVAALDEQGIPSQIVTQFVFDAEPVLNWLTEVRQRGIGAPVRIGLPGPASAKTLLRFAARCGVGASAKVLSKYGLSLTRLLATTGPDRLLQDIAEGLDPAIHGDVHVHLYPFGGLDKAVSWAANAQSGDGSPAQPFARQRPGN